jgi:PAS domain S-box-containing protein
MSSGSLCSILLCDPDGSRLWHGAGPSLPASYTDAIDGSPVAPELGPCGKAAYSRAPVVVSDFATEAVQFEYGALALAHGLRACWSTPILSSNGSLLGTFAIYSGTPRSPTAQDRRTIERITHLLAIAIERKRAEETLRESEERFRRMADTISEVIWFTSLDPEKVLYVSPSFEKIWGFPVENLYRDPRLRMQVIHPDDRERVTSAFTRWIGGDNVSYHNVEYRIVPPDGAMRWIHERGVLTFDADGKALLASGISTDITERKRAEEQLRRSEAYLAQAQRLSLTGSFGWNVASGELAWSDETYRILGYDRTMKPTLDLVLRRIHPEDMAVVRDRLDRATRDRADLNFEHRLMMPDQTTKHVHVVARAVEDGSSNVDFVGAVMDVTERKQAEEALRASEHLARGQLTALTHLSDSFARESDPDRLLEHVLRTIVEQSAAHSVSVWGRNAAGWLDLVAVVEDGRFQSANDALDPAARIPVLAQEHPVWSEILRSGRHGVLEDIDRESARMRVGSDPDAIWHPMMEDTDSDPARSLLKAHLRRLGVVSILFVPMLVAGKVAGIIGIRFTQKRTFRREEIELTRALAHQAMLAIRLVRLSQQSRQAALEAERNRMARDIHDTLAQAFTGVIVQLEAAADANSKGLPKEAEEHLGRAGDLARESLREARRSVRALRPHALEGKNLPEALETLFQKMTAGTAVQAQLSLLGAPRTLQAEWEENLLRVGQEVLTNVLRHANATHFSARLMFDAQGIRIELRDNGRGFDPEARHDGIGLLGMKERVHSMGGQLGIQSARGAGTVISIALPSTDTSRS